MENNKSSLPELPSERAYRKQYEQFFAPLGRKIAKMGISANFVSYLNLIFSLFTGIAFYLSNNNNYLFIYLALVLLLISGLFDMIDGSVARAHKEMKPELADSKFGAVLDPAIDRYSEALIVFGIMLSGYVPPEFVLFTFVGMIMASYVRARAESLGMKNASVGIERKEKIGLIVIGALLEGLFIQLTTSGIINVTQYYFVYISPIGQYLIGPMAIFVLIAGLLSHLSTYQRLKLAQKYL